MDKKNIQHLQYDENLYDPEDYHQSICKLLAQVGEKLKKNKKDISIVDVGSGHGTLMKVLKDKGYQNVIGMDVDKKCVEMSSRFGFCTQGKAEEIETAVQGKYDVIIMAHVLEHLQNPRTVLEKIKSKCDYIILIVPNPVRTKVLLKHNLFSRDYSNQGHYYCWDRSHFTNFLITYCRLEILSWEIDRVYLIPFRFFRNMFRAVGLLDFIEKKLLSRLFPYFSNSLIVLCPTK
jgi:spermidine synthase